MLRANVDRPEQGCEKQCSIIAVDLWRVGTGAYERYFETSCLNLRFLFHDLECVIAIVRGFFDRLMWSS
jgi:hypothetical protein